MGIKRHVPGLGFPSKRQPGSGGQLVEYDGDRQELRLQNVEDENEGSSFPQQKCKGIRVHLEGMSLEADFLTPADHSA